MPPTIYIALLRGINVGGKNKLPMRDLSEIFTLAGCQTVDTYIQSGNVLFTASPSLSVKIPSVISASIKDRFGYQIPVMLRTMQEMRDVVGNNPFLKNNVDTTKLHVAFLTNAPESAKVAQLDPNRSPPDIFHVRGREIFLHYPNGTARSKLTNAYFDSKLTTTSTIRNWRTIVALLNMACQK